jgi:hypothetical protein
MLYAAYSIGRCVARRTHRRAPPTYVALCAPRLREPNLNSGLADRVPSPVRNMLPSPAGRARVHPLGAAPRRAAVVIQGARTIYVFNTDGGVGGWSEGQ